MKKRNRGGEANSQISEKQSSSQSISNKTSGLFLIALLDRFCDFVYNLFKNGFFGKIFSKYSEEQTKFENSLVAKCSFGSTRSQKFFRKIRETLSKAYETSYFLRKIREFIKILLSTPLKSYGKMFLSFGVYTIVIYFIQLLVPDFETVNISALFLGLAVCLCSIPLLCSRKSLAYSVGHNRITRVIFSEIFDFREELYHVKTYKSRAITNFLILVGMITGLLTFVVTPMIILIGVASILFAVVIIITPEIGVVTSLFAFPFFSVFDRPASFLAIMVLVTAFGYLVKLIRGKRIIRFELIDITVIIFGILIFFGGLFSAGQKASYNSAMISIALMIGYFLIANLIRTRKWLMRCSFALVASGVAVSFFGILQYILGYIDTQTLDTSYFPNILGRTTAMFENANYLAVYLVAVFPFALQIAVTRKSKRSKFFCGISCFSIIVCTILTWSRGAWIAMILTSIIFLLIYSKKTLRWLICLVLTLPYATLLLPDNIKTRFTSIGDMTDSSTMYRFYTWRGSSRIISDHFWGGIGYGPEAYRAVYPEYAYAGIEAAAHSHNLFLQIFISLGIGGFLIFLSLMFLFTQKNFEYIKKPYDFKSGMIASATICAVFAMLIMGMFDYVWYNYRIFFMFWAIIGISVAAVRYGTREIEKKNIVIISDAKKATLEIEIQE